MRAEDFDINRVVEYLQGSCESLDSAIELLFSGTEFEDLTEEDLSTLDNAILNCPSCGWWVDSGEMGETVEGYEEVCDDCAEEYGGRRDD